jgi:AraC-like DNA-binding protein
MRRVRDRDLAVHAADLPECAGIQTELEVAGSWVRSVILGGAGARIRACGRQPAAVARQAGVPVAALRDPELLVSGASVMRFFDLAARACRRRNWGLEQAEGAKLATLIGPLWVLLRNARSVREMCADLARNYDLYTDAALMSFEPTATGGALVSWTASAGTSDNEVQIAEFALAVILEEIRSHGTPGWTPASVRFRHQAPRDLRLHRRVFGPHLRFDAQTNAIEIDAAMLDRPLRFGGETRHRALVRSVLRLQDGAPMSTPLQVEAIVRALLPFAPCSARDVALGLGLSVRTLQERLAASRRSFRSIKDAVRHDLAEKYLRHSGMSATEIADLLGYADLSSLSRSFRRWTGGAMRSRRRTTP